MTRNVIIAIVIAAAVVLAVFLLIRPQSGIEADQQPPHATTNGG